MQERVPGLNKKIRRILDFPKEGIIFWDMATLFRDPEGFKVAIDAFVKRYKEKKPDYITSIGARGFVMGGVISYLLGVGHVIIRKKGKLPYDVIKESYIKEYGPDTIEMQKDAIKKGDNVVIVDDLLATGDTSLAAAKLVERLEGKVLECAYIVEFEGLGAEKKLKKYSRFSLIKCKETE